MFSSDRRASLFPVGIGAPRRWNLVAILARIFHILIPIQGTFLQLATLSRACFGNLII
ncbi:hypothetical protein [Bradyrhizobium sp. 30]|uniref:hypothetical protein n=1 Tax=Bradyrhizobium sp. 30 TaxID=2782669 RepID=UPI001FFA4C01|nr:hypothetical protein [Bradyrhizobium sp. 30]MCK1295549.1 hypothetical protein [Bradyrhizobium sp. 30]